MLRKIKTLFYITKISVLIYKKNVYNWKLLFFYIYLLFERFPTPLCYNAPNIYTHIYIAVTLYTQGMGDPDIGDS